MGTTVGVAYYSEIRTNLSYGHPLIPRCPDKRGFTVQVFCVSFSLSNFLYRQEFFNDLYHRFLLSPKASMKAMCLQAMAIVYGACFEEIGPFNDTEFIIKKLEQVGVAFGS